MKLKGLSQMPKVRRCRYRGCHALVAQPDLYCNQHVNRVKNERSEYNKTYNATVRRKATKLEQYSFYHSKVWKSLRASVLERDMYLCQYCRAQGRVKAGNIVDHLVPVEYDASLRTELSNLVTTCRECHNIKTHWENSYYGTGQNAAKKEVARIKELNVLVRLVFKR